MRAMVGILGLTVLVITTGCQNSCQTLSDKTIRFPALDHGALVSYHVLRTNELSLDRTISVRMGGGVNRPGTLEIPKGTTLLEAIVEAGGFTDSAHVQRLLLAQPDGKRLILKLQRAEDWRSRRSYAWFGETSDWILENGSAVEFPMRTLK